MTLTFLDAEILAALAMGLSAFLYAWIEQRRERDAADRLRDRLRDLEARERELIDRIATVERACLEIESRERLQALEARVAILMDDGG